MSRRVVHFLCDTVAFLFETQFFLSRNKLMIFCNIAYSDDPCDFISSVVCTVGLFKAVILFTETYLCGSEVVVYLCSADLKYRIYEINGSFHIFQYGQLFGKLVFIGKPAVYVKDNNAAVYVGNGILYSDAVYIEKPVSAERYYDKYA